MCTKRWLVGLGFGLTVCGLLACGSPDTGDLAASAAAADDLQLTSRVGQLVASPGPSCNVFDATGLCTTTITWQSSYGVNVEVFVSMDGGPEKLFACNTRTFSQDANWIQPGHDYVFYAYASATCTVSNASSLGRRLASVEVYGAKGVVQTIYGAVQGELDGAVWAYRGIPFAKPPVGSLRFKPPVAPDPWTGIRQSTVYGPKCPQLDAASGVVVGDEDCLTLNVWTNEGITNAPVLVFIHGGGETAGSASEPTYEGAALAARTGAVVVTLDYRLGALGFLAASSLNAESPHRVSGNYGILDQIAALQWVQANIAAFGGSPQRVMLFGESAGAQNTLVHVASPLSRGLFATAAVESGGVYTTTLAQGIAASQQVITAVGCGGVYNVTTCLRSKSAAAFAAVPAAIGPLTDGLHYKPVIDGYVLPADALTAVTNGTHNHVPIILGTNANETLQMVPPPTAVRTAADYCAAVHQLYPAPAGAADELLALYPLSAYASPHEALVALSTDVTWTCPTRRVARALATHQTEPVFRYHFSWKAPAAAHGLELAFVFRTFSAFNATYVPTASDLALSDAMEDYWGWIATSGDPNHGGALTWPRYRAAIDPYLELDTTISARVGLATANCDAIDGLMP